MIAFATDGRQLLLAFGTDEKRCRSCGETKPRGEFSRRAAAKDGLRPSCRACEAEKSRRYRETNAETVRERKRRYYKANPEKAREKDRSYREASAEKRRERGRRWREANPEKARECVRRYQSSRSATDPVFRMLKRIRTRQYKIFRRARRGSFVRDMGCTSDFLRAHIEAQLTGEMTLANYGKVWHLDHIYPLAKVDLTDRVQFLAAVNWRNLRPMLAVENLAKHDAVTPEAQELFDALCREFAEAATAGAGQG